MLSFTTIFAFCDYGDHLTPVLVISESAPRVSRNLTCTWYPGPLAPPEAERLRYLNVIRDIFLKTNLYVRTFCKFLGKNIKPLSHERCLYTGCRRLVFYIKSSKFYSNLTTKFHKIGFL